jgi:hypothetical protein
LNQIGRSQELQSVYQQSLLQSDLEIRQAERRLAAQRRQREISLQASEETQASQSEDLELAKRKTPSLVRGGLGRHMDILA